jgi:glycosyltransferase involved in cell wall biosynthesis
MRFHVLGLPHTQVNHDYSACAFTEKIRRFCIMMKALGHTVFLYAGDRNIAPCDELIVCHTEAERLAFCKGRHFIEASFEPDDWRPFNARIVEAIKQRAQPQDFICTVAGRAQKQINDALPNMIFVEFGIGYGGNYAKFRVWESYAWMHTCYGTQRTDHNPNAIDGHWFDEVIPGYFEPEMFDYKEFKDDYYLFMGRLIERKGYQIAADVCEKLGARLIIAGQGTPPTYGEYVGLVDPAERNRLMRSARAVFVPTQYIEPFGNVAVEAQFCGTPVITTDWGAFTETVRQGVTGFRCRTFGQFVAAAERAHMISPLACRTWAMMNYSLDAVGKRYDDYFTRLLTLWREGWYAGVDAKPSGPAI